MDKIIIKGARENNLKNIDIELPKNKMIVMTGLLYWIMGQKLRRHIIVAHPAKMVGIKSVR